MKLLNALIAFSFAGISVSSEATQLALNLDQSQQQEFNCSSCCISYEDSSSIGSKLSSINSKQQHSLETLKEEIFSQEQPLLALYHRWTNSVQLEDSCEEQNCHPLEILNFVKRCNAEDYTRQFACLCQLAGIPVRHAYIQGKTCYDFYSNDEWVFLDVNAKQFYLSLDNQNLVPSEVVLDDPFIALRAKHDRQTTDVDFRKSWENLAHFEILTPVYSEEIELICPVAEHSNHFAKEQERELVANFLPATLQVTNESSVFDHCTPFFCLKNDAGQPEKIWWQISPKADFSLVPSNFEQVQSFQSVINLSAITDTFFNPEQAYFFRARSLQDGQWSNWSEIFSFTVKKPEAVDMIDFIKIGPQQYEISWQPSAGATDYLVFGSNSIDFIPSIYCNVQVNSIVDGEVVEEIPNDNLITITSDTQLIVDGSLAYYRIIARDRGQLAVPSQLIHVYDDHLHQERDVLQVIEANGGHHLIQRRVFPAAYEWLNQPQSIFGHSFNTQDPIASIQESLAKSRKMGVMPYAYNPYVPLNIWYAVVPYFLPENHPIKPKLDRMFSADRVTQDSGHFKKAGFKRYRVRRNGMVASNHPELKGYFVKAFIDSDSTVKNDWERWIHRIQGAHSIRNYLVSHNYHNKFKVPNKWIYPLPVEPSPPPFYGRKNFILIAEDMQILTMEENKKKYKKAMSRHLLKAMYHIILDEGLFDSVYAFNMPFCKDGKIAFIDTEFHHKWPIPFHKLKRYLSGEMSSYLDSLISKHGYHQPR